MATNLLSAAECKNATAKNEQGEALKVRKLHDGQGLYLVVHDDGKKYWRLRFWVPGHDKQGNDKLLEKSLSLGVFPQISLADARKKAQAAREQLAADIDPAKARKVAVQEKRDTAKNTFEAVANEWFSKQVASWVPSHAIDVRRRLDKNLFKHGKKDLLGNRPINAIDAQELLAAVRLIEARGAHDLAHRVLQVAGQVFRYGIATGKCTRDWSADLKGALTVPVKQHQPAVSPKELPDLLRAIQGYETLGDRQTMLALQLLSLTFVRTGELIGATWDEIDMDKAMWCIPAARMKMGKEHMVPLSTQALAILVELKALAGDSKYVLPGRNAMKSISNNTLLFALYRLGYKSRMTGHGFRSVASTALHEGGQFTSDVIEMQLAHVPDNAVKAAYNRAKYLPDRIKMMQVWADYLDTLTANNVVPIKTATA
jgi:integrase